MTGRPVTPTQQAADVLAATVDFLCPTCHHHYVRHYQQNPGCRHCRFPQDGSAPAACTETMTSALAGSFAAALAAAGVLTDPDTHARDAVEWSPTLRNDGTYEYTVTGDCHGTWEQALRRKPAMSRKPSAWEKCDAVPADALYAHDAALGGAGTDAHREGA